MVIARVLRHVAAELRHLDFRLEPALLERRKQDFAQRDFQPVHAVCNGALVVVHREVLHLARHEILVRHMLVAGVQMVRAIIRGQPHLAVVGALLVEHEINGVVARFARVREIHNLLVLKVLAEFAPGAGAQTLIILDVPCADVN